MENYVQKIIKVPAKLSMAHHWKVLAYANKIYMFVSIQIIITNIINGPNTLECDIALGCKALPTNALAY
jgi:hypothetical protein